MDPAARLMAMFLEELDERLDAFDRDLLALEQRPGDAQSEECVTSLFRGAHSLKGAANAVGLHAIEALCYNLEERLAKIRDGKAGLDEAGVQFFFESADGLRAAGRRLREKDGPAAPPSAPVPRREPPQNGASSSVAVAEAPGRQASDETAPQNAAFRAETVRVAAEKLDALLQQSGELLAVNHRTAQRREEALSAADLVRKLRADLRREGRGRGRVADDLRALDRALDRLASGIAADRSLIEQAARRVDFEVRRIRMMPFAAACEGLERIVRDGGRSTQKDVRLDVRGGETELDRSVLEGLRVPLIHLVRNAIDHGIETPEVRASAGKPATGTVTVRAALRGDGVQVTVTDDGAGLDLVALRQRATARGLTLHDDELPETIFLPGMSTSKEVTNLSGRGVGLDVVQAAIGALRGTIEVGSQTGRGTRFRLKLPLTLTTLRAVMVRVGEHPYAIDASTIERVMRFEPKMVSQIEGRPYVFVDGTAMPLASLGAVLGMQESAHDPSSRALVVIAAGERRAALTVDAALDEREVVVRSLGARLAGLSAIAGATILPDGALAPIVRSTFLFEHASDVAAAHAGQAASEPGEDRKRVLLVDDSMTTRMLERSILEVAGYEVVVAADGKEAWDLLRTVEVDLVVSDVDMPRMDGFTLAQTIRGSAKFRELPIVLVTGRESDEDKRRSLEVGADAYITKNGFDQAVLLETMGQLL